MTLDLIFQENSTVIMTDMSFSQKRNRINQEN